jgi:hypothetical protein
MRGWAKIKPASAYAGVSPRTFRKWPKKGLRHARLPSGTVLIRYEAIDEFISKHEEQQNTVDRIVAELEKELKTILTYWSKWKLKLRPFLLISSSN